MPHNNGMHLTALRAAGDAEAVRFLINTVHMNIKIEMRKYG